MSNVGNAYITPANVRPEYALLAADVSNRRLTYAELREKLLVILDGERAKAQVKAPGYNVPLSHVAYLSRARNSPKAFAMVGREKGEGRHEMSHLCHKRRCVNPDHLVVESRALNVEREGCRVSAEEGHVGVCPAGKHGAWVRCCILP